MKLAPRGTRSPAGKSEACRAAGDAEAGGDGLVTPADEQLDALGDDAFNLFKEAELAASSRAERVDKVRDHLAKVDDAVKLAKKLDANSPAKRWATIMAKADAPSAPAAKSARLPPLAVAVAVVAAAYVARARFAKE